MRKKAKNERGTIMSFFNNNKSDENKTRRRSNSIKNGTRKNKKKVPTENLLGSSVQVEKTSLILFDEVCFTKINFLDDIFVFR